jgi:hypothetical protein
MRKRIDAIDLLHGGDSSPTFREMEEELYQLGRRYEERGRIGRLAMRLADRVSQNPQLEHGKNVYGRAHQRERAIAADNLEIMKSWPKK